jgi:hypothetical protein
MPKIITWIFLAIVAIGAIASLDLIPKAWIDQLPAWGKIALVACLIGFSALTFLGIILDSGLIQRIFKNKQP